METPQSHPRVMQGLSRRALLHGGLAAGLLVSTVPALIPQHSGGQKRDRLSVGVSYACAAMTPSTSIPTSRLTSRRIPP